MSELPTPAYVYELDEVRRAHAELASELPAPSRLYYSLKANPHPAIVAALRAEGCHAEVCSPGELAAALSAGVDPAQMLYTGPGKRDADVQAAVKAGVTWVSVDSPEGLDQVDRVARDLGVVARCLLRVNDTTPVPGMGLTMTGVASQFGADADWIRAAPERFAARPNARLAGLHLYMGTNLTDEAALVAQLRQSIATARDLAFLCGDELEVIDLGGGFAAPYARAGRPPRYPGLAAAVTAALDDAFAGWRGGHPHIAFESGRRLVATAGSLLTRVLDVKRSRDQHVLVLESGINHLGGMSGLRRLPPIVPALHAPGAGGETDGPAIVAGPLCTPLDAWARGATVPRLRAGDLVRVPNVGAYGLTASLLAFLGHPAPAEVVLDGGRIVHASTLTLHRTHLDLGQEHR
ncbi:alanine racemase [Dactylosporangium roseum]|uniref:Alanine racemase n=1 Tax=Dactylosporangium roseum TaxID=47989 RepID=A0ABY5ZBT8_9ACTN|nr:alanine racemase [Dactylosporangium roseum]